MKRPPWPHTRNALLGAGALLIAACAAPLPRLPGTAPSAPPGPASTPRADTDPAPPATPPVPAPDPSPWLRLRTRFAMPGCAYRPEVQRWAQIYARHPQQFAASWKQAMPFLLIVVDEIERRELPGEFALLPYVESRYRPLPANGERPAGMWQLVPGTARAAGLRIDSGYDGRLDALASTGAALDLIERYERQFSDWRLANLAYNSGEFRARKLLGERDASALSAAELARLKFSPGAHEHLDRLLALSCIVAAPQRFGVTLPEPEPGDRLEAVALDVAMDVRLAARLAGVAVEDMKRWNAGYRRHRVPTGAGHRLLLPAAQRERFHLAAGAVPSEHWSDWHEARATRTSAVGSFAAEFGVPVAVLAAANAVGEHATITPGMRLLLPGREAEPPAPASAPRTARVHVVAAGDTLTRIARRYSVPLDLLRRLNPHAKNTLRLGDRLRVSLVENE